MSGCSKNLTDLLWGHCKCSFFSSMSNYDKLKHRNITEGHQTTAEAVRMKVCSRVTATQHIRGRQEQIKG